MAARTARTVLHPAPEPAPAAATPTPTRAPQGGLGGLVAKRSAGWTTDGPSQTAMQRQAPVWNFLMDHYFRLETSGWDRLPDEPSLLVGIHSGGSLTIDAWTLVIEWWRRFGESRILHGTAHDVLMAAPGMGDYFRAMGVLPASRAGVTAALAEGHDVIVWPGGEQDAMRSWFKRDTAVLAGRKGFVKQAIRSRVPIVPVATVGGHDTVFILSEGKWLANRLPFLGKSLRSANLPIVAGFPFPLAIEALPVHLPLPAKIRTEILDPIEVDPERGDDPAYVDAVYEQVETAIQDGMNRLAARRSFPIFG